MPHKLGSYILNLFGSGLSELGGNKIVEQLLNLFTKNFAHLIGIIIYGIIALVLSFIGYRCFKAIIPLRVDKGITEKDNIAAGIIIAGIVIGMSIIVAVTSYDPAPILIPLPSASSSSCGTSPTGGCGAPGHPPPSTSGVNNAKGSIADKVPETTPDKK